MVSISYGLGTGCSTLLVLAWLLGVCPWQQMIELLTADDARGVAILFVACGSMAVCQWWLINRAPAHHASPCEMSRLCGVVEAAQWLPETGRCSCMRACSCRWSPYPAHNHDTLQWWYVAMHEGCHTAMLLRNLLAERAVVVPGSLQCPRHTGQHTTRVGVSGQTCAGLCTPSVQPQTTQGLCLSRLEVATV